MILNKKVFVKSMISKKIAHKKIAFCLILPRKMRKFCVLRVLSKSTILKKKNNFKKHDFKEKNFCKKQGFEEKFFVKSMVLNKNFL